MRAFDVDTIHGLTAVQLGHKLHGLLPRLLLRPTGLKGQASVHEMYRRYRAFLAGQWQELYDAQPSELSAAERRQLQEERDQRRGFTEDPILEPAVREMTFSRPSSSLSRILSSGLFPNAWLGLLGLHFEPPAPERDPEALSAREEQQYVDQLSQPLTPAFLAEVETALRHILLHLDRGVSPGPDGERNELLLRNYCEFA
jgi:hypothetical protein